MNDPMLPLPGLSPASGKPVVVKFDGGLLSSDGGVLALREVEQRLRLADRLAACMGSPRSRSRHAQLGRYHSFSAPDDRRRLRGRQRRQLSAKRSDVQDGARSVAVRLRIVLAIDDLAARESAERSRLAAHGPGDGRSLLRVLPKSSQPNHARHRRHVRRGAWRPAVAVVQPALLRVWLSANRRVRRRGPLHHRRPSARQTARRQGNQGLPAPSVARDPRQLAQH